VRRTAAAATRFGRFVAPLVPSEWLGLTLAVSASFSYLQWEVLYVQAAFWIAIATAAVLAVESRRTRGAAITTIAAMAITQAVALRYGSTSPRTNDIKEYRELVIAAALGAYGFQLARDARRPSRARTNDLAGLTPRAG
jgi:hypothetical protein